MSILIELTGGLTGREGKGTALMRAAVWVWLVVAGAWPARAEPLVAEGITEPVCDVFLSPSVAGIISSWNFKEGDFVTTNQVIIQLDKDLETLEVDRRKLVMDNRKEDLDALQKLVKQSSISVKKEEMEKAETEYRIAVTEHAMAVEQLRRRSVSAPCAGFISEITRDPGEACQPYQPLVRVVDTRQCYLVSNMEAKAAARLKVGQTVKLQIETAAGTAAFEGTVVFLSPVVDTASGLQKVKIQFENSAGKIRPGVAGKAYIE